MAGFSVDATGQKVMFTDNVDYSGAATPTGQFTSNGQIAIGSLVAPHIRVSTLTPGSGVTILNGPGSITIGLSGAALQTLTGNSGGAISPTAGNINIVTANATPKFVGSGSTLTQDFNLTNIVLGSSLPSLSGGATNAGVGLNCLNAVTSGFGNAALGAGAMSHTTTASACVAIGANALAAVAGDQNVAIGYQCLQNYTGADVTAVGFQALTANVSGGGCTAVGANALTNNTAANNDAFGSSSGQNQNTGAQNCSFGNGSLLAGTAYNYCSAFGFQSLNACTGDQNSAFGRASFNHVTSGTNNTGCGFNAGFNTTGSRNTFLGSATCTQATGASDNIGIGYLAANNYTTTESSNIMIGNAGTLGDNNTIRIGTQGSGAGQQNAAYIAGIAGVTVSNTNLVTVNTSTGQLGSQALATGTFTPTLVGNSVAGTTTYSSQNGYYTQIGNLVTVIGTINYTAATGTGNMLIGGLPFTIKNQTQGNTMGSVLVSSAGTAWPAGTTSTVIYGQLNTTTAEIYCTGTLSAGGFMQMANTSGGISFTMTYQV